MYGVQALVTFIFGYLAISVGANAEFKSSEDAIKYLQNHISSLTQQTMLQQFFSEQRVRQEGQSGLKLSRQRRSGTKNYHVETHTGYAAAAIHDHSNNIRTVGMGEFSAVLNGIEFKTRHNDYSLQMSHKTSSSYHATEPIPFPDVPPAVLAKGDDIQGQVDEMREWFKAWRDQDHSVRDYRDYFKPVMCYLEGAWSNSGQNIDEPFKSDRHFVDAATWMELHDKARFVAYTGTKSLLENLSFLPTKIMGLINGTVPDFAQWNYRILCHPIKKKLSLNRLRVMDDLSSRMMTGRTILSHINSRAARFQLNSIDQDKFSDYPRNSKTLLDEIMEEIPGKNNHQGHLTDEGLDAKVLNDDKTMKDVSKYHRWFEVDGRDAMGTAKLHRGFSDDYLFAAMNTQDKVAGVSIKKCTNPKDKKTCYQLKQKWSYAIPIELIFLTPLYKWNPYSLTYHGDHYKGRHIAQKNGRYGDCVKKDKELDGLTSRLFYQTPAEFYTGGNVGSTNADTARGVTCVLDPKGQSRQVRASGTYVFLPYIKDVGVLRQRYPIFPVHGEGSSVWKELNALKDIYMNDLKHMTWSKDGLEEDQTSNVELVMGDSNSPHTTLHTHKVHLTAAEALQIKGDRAITKLSSTANGHQHSLEIRYDRATSKYYYRFCDNQKNCFDKHRKIFSVAGMDNQATA